MDHNIINFYYRNDFGEGGGRFWVVVVVSSLSVTVVTTPPCISRELKSSKSMKLQWESTSRNPKREVLQFHFPNWCVRGRKMEALHIYFPKTRFFNSTSPLSGTLNRQNPAADARTPKFRLPNLQVKIRTPKRELFSYPPLLPRPFSYSL